MADVVLINPRPTNSDFATFSPGVPLVDVNLPAMDQILRQHSATPPLGLMYIAAYLRAHGYGVTIIDLRQRPLSQQAFLDRLCHESPRVVGVSVLTELYSSALQIAQTVKTWNPSVWVTMGGPHVTFVDEEPLRSGWVDIVVRREGELTMLDLIQQLLDVGESGLASVAGITYIARQGVEMAIRRNRPRPLLADLDILPLPARDLINLSAYQGPGAMITSRGCPHRCIFCAATAMAGGRYRLRGVIPVVDEMCYLHQDLGIPAISIVDDTMTAVPQRLQAICQRLLKVQFTGTWVCESRVDHVTQELLHLMAEAGCHTVQFGVESGDPTVLKAIRKGITVEQIERAVRWAREAGLRVKCSAIIGHHVDTLASICATGDFLARLRDVYGVSVALGINTPFPGTFLNEHAAALGINILTHDWSEYNFHRAIIDTSHLSRTEIQYALERAILQTGPVAIMPTLAALEKRLNVNRETLIQLTADAKLRIPTSAHSCTSVWLEATDDFGNGIS